MWPGFKQFDSYTLRARIFPALIAGLPTLALLFVLVPWDHLGISHVIASTVSVVLLFAFAGVARRAGLKVERELRTRATPELWHRGNTEIDSITKARFRTFVEGKLQTNAPTEAVEAQNIDQANEFYLAANAWIRDNTRDTKKFKILFDELVYYGAWRNILGLKPIALTMNVLILCIVSVMLYIKWEYTEISHIGEKLILVMIAAILHSAFMIFFVNKNSVREASKSYGKQLIYSCETLMKRTQNSSKPRK